MDSINLKVPAKVNLYLKIIRKRPDGYHDIDTLMQAIGLCDELTLEKSNQIELVCDDFPQLPPEKNLALKAAKLVAEMSPISGVNIILKKNIPVGAGLGGGSADAAFVIRGLINLFDLKLDTAQLIQRVSNLGADIPFFLGTGQAQATGIGDILNNCLLPLNYEILLVKPDFEINTATAYKNYQISGDKISYIDFIDTRPILSFLVKVAQRLSNDFEKAAFLQHPELAQIKQTLIASGALYAGMTGSGSAMFGLFSQGFDLNVVAAKFANAKLRTYACQPILLEPIYG